MTGVDFREDALLTCDLRGPADISWSDRQGRPAGHTRADTPAAAQAAGDPDAQAHARAKAEADIALILPSEYRD